VGSGRPFNILAGTDLNGDGDGGAFPSDRARRVPSDPTSSIRRNLGRLPSQATVDIRVSRDIDVRPRVRVSLILEAFNVFNRTNFIEVNNIFGPGSYPENPLPTFGLYQ